LLQKLDAYQSWLLQITIVDPACGSGAFLNQALDFLIQEHRNIDELRAQLLGESIVLPDHEVAILENNIFGVDLNEESVEIARLSLWLRTARKGRKLNSLNNNIKCGNSLIDDVTIAGDKAFNWQKEFPKIFEPINKETFHITCVMHNTRTSERMIRYKVEKGQAEYLSINEEEKLTEIIVSIFKEDKLNILAYNICADHVHFLIVCEEEKLSKIIQKIKAKSAREFNIWRDITVTKTSEHDHLQNENVRLQQQRGITQNHLWAQKYNCVKIESDKQLWNTIEYIKNNRNKHELLPLSNGAYAIVQSALCTEEYAYRTEYTGGFDVVIGNPPYVSSRNIMVNEKNNFKQNFKSAVDQYDLYVLFIEKGINILRTNGFLSFITPDKFLISKYGDGILSFISSNAEIINFWDLTKQNVFEDASVYPVIFNLKKINFNNLQSEINKKSFTNKSLDKIDDSNEMIIEKIENFNSLKLNTWRPLATSKEITVGNKMMVSNGEINRYNSNPIPNKESNNSRDKDTIKNKIILKKLCYNIEATFDKVGLIPINTTYCIYEEDVNILKYILSILNSKLISFYARNKYINTSLRGGYIELRVFQVEQLPIKKISLSEQQPFIEKAEIMLQKNKELQTIKNNFIKLLQSRYTPNTSEHSTMEHKTMEHAPLYKKTTFVLNVNTKLSNWNELSFKDFCKELEKQKIKLTISEQAELMQYFETEQTKANTIQQIITQTDKEIDQMVYQLYELTTEEIAIIENN
jgi:REP element-mobilizing transposase RayT